MSEAWKELHDQNRELIGAVHKPVGFFNAMDGSEDDLIIFKEGKDKFDMSQVIFQFFHDKETMLKFFVNVAILPLSQYASKEPTATLEFSDEESSCEDMNDDENAEEEIGPIVVPQHAPMKRAPKRKPKPKLKIPKKNAQKPAPVRRPRVKKKKKKQKKSTQAPLIPPPPPVSTDSQTSLNRGRKRPGPREIASKRLKKSDGSFSQL